MATLVVLVFFVTIPFGFHWLGTDVSIGEAKVLYGEMTISRDSEDKTVSSSSKIQVGDTISLGADSQVELRFIDESTSILSSGTILFIDNVLINQANIKNSIILLNLLQGEMDTSVDKHDGELARVQIQTPSSIIEAQSSDFKVAVSKKNGTEVTPSKNSVKVKAIAENTRPTAAKKVLAEAQVVEGYKIKVPTETGSSSHPLEIVNNTPPPVVAVNANENRVELPLNTNGNADITNANEAPPTVDPGYRSNMLGQLEIAKVKLYQAIRSLNSLEEDDALVTLREYREKLVQIFNAISSTPLVENMDNKDLATILTPSLLDDIQTQAATLPDTEFQKEVLLALGNLRPLETSITEKIVRSTLTVYVTPPAENGNGNDNSNAPLNDNTNGTAGNENANTAATVEQPPEDNVAPKLDGQLTYQVQNLVNLVDLKETLSEEKQVEIDQIIAYTIDHIVTYINGVEDWKVQQKETLGAMNLIPNNKAYESSLLKLRQKLSDRVSYMVTNKIRKLR